MGLRADSARPLQVSGSAHTDSRRAESARNPMASHNKFGDDSALSAFTRTQWTAAFRHRSVRRGTTPARHAQNLQDPISPSAAFAYLHECSDCSGPTLGIQICQVILGNTSDLCQTFGIVTPFVLNTSAWVVKGGLTSEVGFII